jgi:TonB-dependent SusC/RagA subfamily outer membrane receptor
MLFSSQKVYQTKKPFKKKRTIFLLYLIGLLLFPAFGFAQNQINGTVKDNNGVPMGNVSVIIKNSSKGTTTDASGNYSIPASSKDVLVFSYTGYASEDIPVKGQKTVNAVLKLESSRLTDVIVVGYGTQKRSDITGSVSSVPKDRLTMQPVTNVLQAIQGSVAGVNISSSNAAPGSVASIYIRGLNSISASTAPLIVLDGLPFSGSWNDININDIASIEILKDASATAIYGTRGSNGVICNYYKNRNQFKTFNKLQWIYWNKIYYSLFKAYGWNRVCSEKSYI